MQTFCYTRHQVDETLIDFLSRRFPYQSRDAWEICVRSGQVRLNGIIVASSVVLKSKDVISYQRPRESEPAIDDTFRILHQDDAIVVVEKSGNIPISESGKYYRNTLINILKEQVHFKELFAVHRLDKETSGVVVIARTKEVATILGKQFVAQIPKKVYHAVLVGEMADESILVDRPIRRGRENETKVRVRQVVADDGKPSKTAFTRLFVVDGLTLAEVKTYSGRTHQIRCHAEYIQLPILGDKLYGQEDDTFIQSHERKAPIEIGDWGVIDRQLLHASSISFRHPVTEDWLTFVSDYKPLFSKYPATSALLSATPKP